MNDLSIIRIVNFKPYSLTPPLTLSSALSGYNNKIYLIIYICVYENVRLIIQHEHIKYILKSNTFCYMHVLVTECHKHEMKSLVYAQTKITFTVCN